MIMRATFNQIGSEQPFTTGWQQFGEDLAKSIIHTLNHSLDFRSKASLREFVIFLLFGAVLLLVFIPDEDYPTLLATISIYAIGFFCALLVFVIPMTALCIRLLMGRDKK